ncbi:MAG: hypothetical protein KC619_09710 [Myxococcales bacterium]|nr:hypothetical protein [Myxococcales bacterium]
MTRARTLLGLLLVSSTLLAGCGGFHIRPPTPLRPVVIGSFEVVYGPQIPGDRQRLLDRAQAPARMAAALRQSYPAGPGPLVRMIITQFRSGRWGPTRMHAVVQVLGPGGAVLNQFEVDATSMNGASRGQLIQSVAQACVDQVAQRL